MSASGAPAKVVDLTTLNEDTMRIVLQQIDRLDRDDFKILAGGPDPTPQIDRLYAEMGLPTVPSKSTVGKIFTILTRRIQEKGVNPYAIFTSPMNWDEDDVGAQFLSEYVTGPPSKYLQSLRLRLVQKYPQFIDLFVGGKRSKRSKSKRSKSKRSKSKRGKSRSKRSKTL
jgi:hypothetical protein